VPVRTAAKMRPKGGRGEKEFCIERVHQCFVPCLEMLGGLVFVEGSNSITLQASSSDWIFGTLSRECAVQHIRLVLPYGTLHRDVVHHLTARAPDIAKRASCPEVTKLYLLHRCAWRGFQNKRLGRSAPLRPFEYFDCSLLREGIPDYRFTAGILLND